MIASQRANPKRPLTLRFRVSQEQFEQVKRLALSESRSTSGWLYARLVLVLGRSGACPSCHRGD